jgi:hypothetical protein
MHILKVRVIALENCQTADVDASFMHGHISFDAEYSLRFFRKAVKTRHVQKHFLL